MKANLEVPSLIDFKEIEDKETFVDLVFELLNIEEGVINIDTTGVGTDFGGDIIVHVERYDPLVKKKKRLKAVVECKHLAMSNRAVSKKDIKVYEALLCHNADIYLLVTSTRVGAFYTKVIQEIQEDKRYRGQNAACWDGNYLKRELLKDKNQDLLLRFLPESFNRVKEFKKKNDAFQKSIKSQIIEDVKDYPLRIKKDAKLHRVYLINSYEFRNVFQESALHDRAKKMGVILETSADVVDEWLWSFEKSRLYNKFLERADAVFAIVDKKGAKSPNVWLEIEKAKSMEKLKAIFIDESVYSITLLSTYPCIILKKNLKDSISDFEEFYRRIFQEWNDKDNKWFWFSLGIIFYFYNFPAKIKP